MAVATALRHLREDAIDNGQLVADLYERVRLACLRN
jgi:hypothetical protein